MKPSRKTLQERILRALADSQIGHTPREIHSLFQLISSQFGDSQPPDDHMMLEALWSLVSQGLIILDFQGISPIAAYITPDGKAAAEDEDPNPDFPPMYLDLLADQVPQLSDLVTAYVKEALRTYGARSYLATSVMLGVASEGALLEMADAFAEWMDREKGQDRLKRMLETGRDTFSRILEEVRKRLASHQADISDTLKDGLDAIMSVADVLRNYRNDAGHPTGATPTREECFRLFVVLPGYVERLYGLKEFFAERSPSA